VQVSRLVRKLLIVSQVALTGTLLAVSVHVLQLSLRHLAQPLGFATQDLHYLSLSLGGQLQASPEERANNLLAIRSKLREHPKVVDASLASGLPIHRGGDVQWKSFLSAEQDFNQQYQAATSLVDDRYLGILELPLLNGRNFRVGDEQAQTKVLIVNETFARQLQADGQVLGQRFYWRNSPDRGKTPYEVIGIVRDVSLPGRVEESRMFVPQLRTEEPLVLVQLKPGQELGKAEINELLAQVNGEYKVSTALSMVAARNLLVAQDSLSASVTAALVVLALILAVLGIYGVLSYTVSIRRLELGIRMALGARPSTVFMQVLRDDMMPMIVGLAVALIALGVIWRWLQSSEYVVQVSPFSWVLSAVLIVTLAAAATLLSVWRIISKPAIHALRNF
jgi:putative ABC transport system permease protein